MEMRRSYDRLISTMGFPILVRRHLYIESGPLRHKWPDHQESRDMKLTEESAQLAVMLLHKFSAALLTHWGRVTHICVGKLTIIGSDNGLSPGRRQAIIWTNAGILLIGPIGTDFSEILTEIYIFHSRKCTWKCRLRNGVHFVSASMC